MFFLLQQNAVVSLPSVEETNPLELIEIVLAMHIKASFIKANEVVSSPLKAILNAQK